MSHCFYHALSSAKKFGGLWQDYIDVHSFFDHTKAHVTDNRHRMVLHNGFGIFLAERVFGTVLLRKSDGKAVPIRLIGEQHVLEDLGRIPTLEECLKSMPLEQWMVRATRRLSLEFKLEEVAAGEEKNVEREGR
jgi:hypothetical protein